MTITSTDLKPKFDFGLEVIGASAFALCQNLEEIILPESLIKIGPSAFERTGLTSVKIPPKIKIISGSTFYGANILELELNEGLEEIGGTAFSYNPITEVIIPGCTVTVTLSSKSNA